MDQQWWQKYHSFKDYDYTLRSINTVAGISTFDTIPLVLEDSEDMLLIKVDLYKAPSKNSTLKLTLSGSQV